MAEISLDRMADDFDAVVTGGLPIATEAEFVRYPDRYMDERVEPLWNRVMSLLARRREGGGA